MENVHIYVHSRPPIDVYSRLDLGEDFQSPWTLSIDFPSGLGFIKSLGYISRLDLVKDGDGASVWAWVLG